MDDTWPYLPSTAKEAFEVFSRGWQAACPNGGGMNGEICYCKPGETGCVELYKAMILVSAISEENYSNIRKKALLDWFGIDGESTQPH